METSYDKLNDTTTNEDYSQLCLERIVIADHRALAVGSYEAPLSNTLPEPKTHKIYYNMSGFHGNAGGMVCHFEGGDVLKPKVIGLCEEPTLILFLTR